MTLLLTAVGQVYGGNNHCAIDDESEDNCACQCAHYGKGFISADLLYWRAFEGGFNDSLPIEDADYVSSNGNIIAIFREKNKHPRFNWNAGFQLGTGYEFASGWDIALFWTHFHSQASRHQKNDDGLKIDYKNRWKLNFEVVDAIFGHHFKKGAIFTWTPFAGLRGAKIEQKFRSNFVNRADSYSESSLTIFSYSMPTGYLTDVLTTSTMHSKQKFFGMGPVAGVELSWDLGWGFSVSARGSVAGLYGYFRVKSNELDEIPGVIDLTHVRKYLETIQAIVDAELCISWHTCFWGCNLRLQVGYEHHGYFNQNHFLDYGDLHLDGANFSATLAF
jgi:hypothetical protein